MQVVRKLSACLSLVPEICEKGTRASFKREHMGASAALKSLSNGCDLDDLD